MLDVARLGSRYGRIPALAGVDLRVGEGELVALVGGNGAGKTTLLRVLSGVQPASAGSVRFDGDDVTRASPRARVKMGIVQVPEGRQVFAPMSVEDNLRLGAFTRPASDLGAALARVFDLFPVLRTKRRDAAGTLSGGQQQMLAIGRALMAKPRLLLLDEPGMGLAPRLCAEIFAVIRALKDAATTILLVDQNARAALAIADRAYVLETGRIVHDGPANVLRYNDELRRAYLAA